MRKKNALVHGIPYSTASGATLGLLLVEVSREAFTNVMIYPIDTGVDIMGI
jgi:hypothetical protein